MNLLKINFLCTVPILFSAKTDKVKIILIVDSNVLSNSKNAYPAFGWEEGFQNLMDREAVIDHHAANSNGSLSFIREVYWEKKIPTIYS
jgi:nanoRNase/pAp phosphatase (c-di-AMP/oligoRNAs hydrolase)